jgi:hypothetical protein
VGCEAGVGGLSHGVRSAALRPSLLTLNFQALQLLLLQFDTLVPQSSASISPVSNDILDYIGRSVESFAMEASVPASILSSRVLTKIV